MEYKKEEIESLAYYTSRKSTSYFDYEMINKFLKFLSNPQDLYYGTSKWIYLNPTKIKEILGSIRRLYILCCKYGKTHNIPKNIYRQEHHYNDILAHIDKLSNQWIAESFLSFTKDIKEVKRFKFNEDCKLLRATTDNDLKSNKIPFIDVTDVLGKDPYLQDEKEILIPPFTLIEIENKEKYSIKILSEDNINLESYDSKPFQKELENFIKLYQTNQDKQLNISRKRLNYYFTKELTQEKVKIMF